MKKCTRGILAFVVACAVFLSVFIQMPVQIAKAAESVTISYKSHIQTFGWENQWKTNGAASGTSGMSKRLEGIRIRVDGDNLGVRYTTHCQTYGWLPWVSDGEMSGTEGEAKRLEAIKIVLTGANAGQYDVYYRVHAQSYGWLPWAKNGQAAGTAGFSKRLEAIQIRVVPKGTNVPNDWGGVSSRYSQAFIARSGAKDAGVDGETATNVFYRTHVQTYGWQGWKYNGASAGTSGQAKRLEAIRINLSNKQYTGSIMYRTHVQSYGWQNWVSDGELSGTSGQAKRLEAIQIYLTGELAEHYDVYYRVHAQSYGWLGWVKNGQPSGTAGYAKRLEAIQIVLVNKNAGVPGNVGGVVSLVNSGFINKPGVSAPDNPAESASDDPDGGTSGNLKPGQDVTKYTYEIIPLLAPFNEYFYVKTDNPDPAYVRFVDKSSKYASEGVTASLIPTTRKFLDVQYENKETGRVKGGYIFQAEDAGSDGGQFVLQQADRAYEVTYSGNVTYYNTPNYTDTSVVVSCAPVQSLTDYLIDNYTNPSMGFFEKLNSVQQTLDRMAVYPKNIEDSSKPDPDYPYPLLATSPYAELSLNDHYSMFQASEERLFLTCLHPMVLSSVGVPGVMANVAKTLNPDCTVESGLYHWEVDVTWNGETHSYGGAGTGTTDPLYSKYVEKLFLFDGTAADYATYPTLDKMRTKILDYGTKSSADLAVYKDQITGDTFRDTIKNGNWLRVGSEGWFGYGQAYTYVSAFEGIGNGVYYVEDVWVDGRYVNKWNCIDRNASYASADYRNADILIRNKTFTNSKGQTVTHDVLYEYDSTDDCWYAIRSYYERNWWTQGSEDTLPADMVLTRAQVNAMQVDKNAGQLPTSGLIYDGTVAPGTPF